MENCRVESQFTSMATAAMKKPNQSDSTRSAMSKKQVPYSRFVCIIWVTAINLVGLSKPHWHKKAVTTISGRN